MSCTITSSRWLPVWAITLCLAASPAAAQTAAAPASATAPAPKGGSRPGPITAAQPGVGVREIVVTARRLSAARAAIEPSLGASTYTLSTQAISILPGGENNSLNQVVLQTPGVTQDSFGQLHVRGDHGNLQYRINNVILPEGLGGFGQALSPRLAQSVELITGALPAQYGLRTAGIVNIKTKTGFTHDDQVSLYGGSHGTLQPDVEIADSSGANSWFGSLAYNRNRVGIESPDGSAAPRHDVTEQWQAFGYLDRVLDDSSSLSLILGASDQHFQIPQRVGLSSAADGYQDPAGNPLIVNGVGNAFSQDIDSNQQEITAYAIASYLKTTGKGTVQASMFTRYSSLDYRPDPVRELLFNGISQAARKSDSAVGLQVEGSWDLNATHTVRAGLIAQTDHTTSATSSLVLLVAGNGAAGGAPMNIVDNSSRDAQQYSIFLQDEWRPVDRLTVNYGLRFDQVNALRHENQISPRVNLVWKATPDTTMHAGYSRYFTPPPFELVTNQTLSKFVGTTAAPVSLTNTTPYAERADYFDLGLQQRVGPALTLGIDSYLRRSRHILDEGQFGAPIILTPFNYHDGRVRGVEFTATYAKGPFSAYGNLAISRAQGRQIETSQFNFDPGDLAYIANHWIYLDHDQHYTASTGASYRWGPSRITVDALYGSGLRAQDTVNVIPNGRELPGYVQVNASLSHRFERLRGGPLEARLDIINLFDEKYLIRDGTGVGVGQPQWGARRGVFVGLTKNF